MTADAIVPDGESEVVTLKQAAQMFGVSPSYMQVLPSRHPQGSKTPFPTPVGEAKGPGRGKLYRFAELEAWMAPRSIDGRPRSRPPEYLSPGQWEALVRISMGQIKQLPFGKRYWGTHPIGDGVDPVLDQRVVGSLMAEGYVRAVGRRGRNLRFEPTEDGKDLLNNNPDWYNRTLEEIAARRATP